MIPFKTILQHLILIVSFGLTYLKIIIQFREGFGGGKYTC